MWLLSRRNISFFSSVACSLDGVKMDECFVFCLPAVGDIIVNKQLTIQELFIVMHKNYVIIRDCEWTFFGLKRMLQDFFIVRQEKT